MKNKNRRIKCPQPGWAGAPIAVAGLSLLALMVVSPGCQTGPSSATSTAPSYGANPVATAKAELFTLPADQVSHIAIVSVEKASIARTLRLTGAVTYNSFQTTPVITQVSGPVSRILVTPGQVVQQGEPMLFVSSPDFAQLRSNYLKARDAFQLADKNYQRAADLYNHHAIAQADLFQAESSRTQSQADLQAAEQALRVLGVRDLTRLAQDPGTPEIPVLAPISGEAVERLAAPGQVVQAGQTQVFTISDMSSVWVLANVYERDLGIVRLGDPVTIQSDAYTQTFRGRISYIASALDPATRTLQVRIVTANPGKKLKKDMYVTALVQAGAIEGALVVPDSALLRNSENQPFVYVAQGSNQFAQRLVILACEPQELVWVRGSRVTARRAVEITLTGDADHWYTVAATADVALADVDAVLMRKDPPFDSEFFYATHLLSQAEREGARVFNKPSALREHPEKLAILEFPQFISPTVVTRDPAEIRAFHAEHRDIILKPLDGMGGMGIFRVKDDGLNLGSIIETLNQGGAQTVMVQRFIPAISEGDKRILIIGGKPVPHCLARIPQGGEVRGNLAAGGKGVARPLTARDREIAEYLGPILAARGLLLVGLDVIGENVTEINVTSPTCFQEITDQSGFDVARMFVDALEEALA